MQIESALTHIRLNPDFAMVTKQWSNHMMFFAWSIDRAGGLVENIIQDGLVLRDSYRINYWPDYRITTRDFLGDDWIIVRLSKLFRG